MFEQAFRNIETVAISEMYPDARPGALTPGSRAAEYFGRLAPEMADRAGGLLARLDETGVEPDYAITRARFAAAASGLAGATARLSQGEYFVRVAEVDPATFLAESSSLTEEDWANDVRHNVRVQRETRAISLLARTPRVGEHRHNQYVRDNRGYAARLPGLMSWLLEFAATVGGGALQLARVVNLRGGGQVYRHVDRGLYYLIRDRYHLVLKSSGSRMKCEDRESVWWPGEVWWFNNHVRHQAFNDAETERIHVIFDVLPREAAVLVPYFQKCSDDAAGPAAWDWP